MIADPQVAPTLPSATAPSLLSPPSSTSSSTEASIALAPQHLQHQPTNNDLALHTQLQLQTYLQDLEEADADEAQVEAAVHASLLPAADGAGPATGAMDDPLLDPLSAPLHHPSTLGGPAFGFPGDIPSGTTTLIGASDLLLPFTQTELTVESFQHQMHMLSLESAVLGLEGLTLHEDGGATNSNGGAGADGNEGAGGVGGGGLGRNSREHGEHLHDFFEEMDDDDEECLPPSETKYILYDDHVSPISIADALTILNGNLYGDMMDRETLLTEGWYQHQHLHPHLTLPRYHHHALEDEDMPINSDVLSTASSMINKAHLGRGFRGGVYDGSVGVGRGEGREEEEMVDPADNSMAYLQDDTSQEVAHWLTNYGTTLDAVADQGICLEEDPLQTGGGPGPLGGLGISLNLAGNNVSPVTIHELFFSRYYSRIVYLNLWDTNLGTWGAQAVGGLLADRACRVQYLNLGCNRLKFEGIVQLSGLYKNESLVELDLSENNLGPKAVHSLQQVCVLCLFWVHLAPD